MYIQCTCICTVCVFVCMSVCVPLGLFIILSFLSLYNVCSMVLDACAFHVHESVHVYSKRGRKGERCRSLSPALSFHTASQYTEHSTLCSRQTHITFTSHLPLPLSGRLTWHNSQHHT